MAEKKKILYIVEAMGGGVFTYIVDSDRQKLKKRKNCPLFKKNCSRKSKSQATQRSF